MSSRLTVQERGRKTKPPTFFDPSTLPPLPDGWAWTTLGDILTEPLSNGRSVPTAESGFPVLRLTALKDGRIDLAERKIGQWTEAEASRFLVAAGDFLVSRGNGSLSLVGRGGLVSVDPDPVAYPDTLIRVRADDSMIASTFLARLWNSRLIREQIERSARTTAGIHKVNQADLSNIRLPLPPRDEQDRIVDAIETQLARLNDAVAALESTRTRLKRYRASVLKAACEGRLVPTEAELARRGGRDFEPASVLLERIAAERAASGQGRGRKAKAPVPLDTATLPPLPGGWSWTTLANIASLKGGITKGNKPKPGAVLREVPYLRVANVQRGWLALSEIKTIEATEDRIEELRLVADDILFNEGGDRDKLGRGWVWQNELPECIHQNHVFRARLNSCAILSKFVSSYTNTSGQQYFLSVGKQTTNLASINMTTLGQLPVPIPPTAEQMRIMEEVERRLSVIDQMGATVETSLKRAEAMRQAILRQAFSGKLIESPQEISV